MGEASQRLLSMHEQCVPGSLFSTHAQEPGNEDVVYKITHNVLGSSHGPHYSHCEHFWFVYTVAEVRKLIQEMAEVSAFCCLI